MHAATLSGMAQLVTRVRDDLVQAIDRLVDEGVVASRSDAVRLALERLVDRERRRRVGESIVEGYRRVPQTDAELEWADAATREMLEEESW
jgi:Arc/MetJ-type ribon-helix-helix transcriptional regulator